MSEPLSRLSVSLDAAADLRITSDFPTLKRNNQYPSIDQYLQRRQRKTLKRAEVAHVHVIPLSRLPNYPSLHAILCGLDIRRPRLHGATLE